MIEPPGAARRWSSRPVPHSYQMLALRAVCAVGNARHPHGGVRSPLDPIMCTDGRAFAGIHSPFRAARAPGGRLKFAYGSRAEQLTEWLPRGACSEPRARWGEGTGVKPASSARQAATWIRGTFTVSRRLAERHVDDQLVDDDGDGSARPPGDTRP